jgi:hypothetical protein
MKPLFLLFFEAQPLSASQAGLSEFRHPFDLDFVSGSRSCQWPSHRRCRNLEESRGKADKESTLEAATASAESVFGTLRAARG